MENGDETLANHAAEKTAPNGGVQEEFIHAAAHPVKSYAAVASENAASIGGMPEEVTVSETHPAKSYAAVAAKKTAPNGVEPEEVTVSEVHPAKSYAAVAANAEIEDLRATNSELEKAVAKATQENQTLAAETHRLEGLYYQAREGVATAEHAAATTEGEVASLRAEVEHLQALINKQKLEREEDKRHLDEVAAEVEATSQIKLKLEKEIEALKASATAASVEDRETDSAAVVPKEEEIAWQGMAAAAVAGAAITAAVVLVFLRLKR